MRPIVLLPVLMTGFGVAGGGAAEGPSAAAYDTIQAAIDANPGRMILVPAGDYPIDRKLRLRGDGSGLHGPGRIIQRSADQPIIEIEDAAGAEIRDLTLSRAE